MTQVIVLDVAPDPMRTGAFLGVILLVIVGFIALLSAGVVLFLWYRKRSLRSVEMIRPDALTAERTQPSNPNQA
jgi:hypothetical protein